MTTLKALLKLFENKADFQPRHPAMSYYAHTINAPVVETEEDARRRQLSAELISRQEIKSF